MSLQPSTMINMFELTKIHKRYQQNKIKVYDEILGDCHKKIYNVVKINDKSECIFKIPVYKFGLPKYNRDACLAHILIKLRKNGFDAKCMPPDRVYISWEKHKQTYFYDPNVLMIENNPSKSREILHNLNKEKTESPPKLSNSKYLYKNSNNRRDKDFIEQPTQGNESTAYVSKFYKELNEKYLV
jgi:hypothetical protein